MREGRYDEAHQAINEYIAINPSSTIALHLKALLYERAGDYERALAQWQMAADSSALNAHARSKVAYLSERLGREVPLEPSYLYRTRVAEQAGTGQRIVP